MTKFSYFFFSTILFILIVVQPSCAQSASSPSKTLRHVVLFKFKDSAKPEDVKKIEEAFNALKGKITLIKDFEWGINNSPENLNQGLTHCFFATFNSEKDRNDYLVHPAHKAFVEILLPFLDKATVVDYWASR
ncbi:Dabb family protein [soil metagenome]